MLGSICENLRKVGEGDRHTVIVPTNLTTKILPFKNKTRVDCGLHRFLRVQTGRL